MPKTEDHPSASARWHAYFTTQHQMVTLKSSDGMLFSVNKRMIQDVSPYMHRELMTSSTATAPDGSRLVEVSEPSEAVERFLMLISGLSSPEDNSLGIETIMGVRDLVILYQCDQFMATLEEQLRAAARQDPLLALRVASDSDHLALAQHTISHVRPTDLIQLFENTVFLDFVSTLRPAWRFPLVCAVMMQGVTGEEETGMVLDMDWAGYGERFNP